MLEVAVIGAGASALAASRHLIREGLRPSVFEASKTLGGAWATNHSKMWGGLTTNLSKHTCRFSEWPWPEDPPTFPSAGDMGRYLDGYAAQFLDPTCVQYQCQVTNIEALGTSTGSSSSGYRVEWTDLSTFQQHSKEFEGVIVATGFFSKPHFPAGLDRTNPKTQSPRVIHSSEYQSPMDFINQTVAVVGSSFSALEIAVEIATTAERVLHVVPRIPWVLPRYVPAKVEQQQQQQTSPTSITTAGTSILPVDLALYRRTKDAPQLPELRDMSPDICRSRHEFLHSIIGKRQANTPLGIPANWEEPPMVAISDYYLDMIVQGNVQVIHGRFVGLSDDNDNITDADDDSQSEAKPTWQVETPTGQPVYLKDVDRVICATGFESSLSDFLHPDILDTLEYDSTDTFCPMTCCWETLHPKLPNLYFCGMYRGPYMGIMELQGRLAAKALSGKLQLDQETMNQALEESRRMRTQHKTLRPQFPHFDYLGFMDTLNEKLQSNDFPTTNVKQGDMVSPAFYQSTNPALAQDEVTALEEQVSRGRDGSRIPAIVLSAIIGEWNFDRRIVHFNDNNRQEHVYGTVKYSRPILDHVLYREDGLYELSSTKTLTVFREYEYQVMGDCLEIYFVELGQRAHLFLSLKFTEQQGNRWVATSDHLCIKDLYQARFEIWLDGLAATHLQITYRVKGPSKDYESTTILTPKTTNLSVGRI